MTYPLVDENGEGITSTEKVANKFCKYLTNIGPNLADKTAPASKSFQGLKNSVPSDSLSSFSHVTAEELKTITKGFKDGKAAGADNIPISIIKKTLDLISGLLSIINLSLSSGVFPDRRKISKIIPIFKSDNASLAQNYSPISILPAFSKIFERAVCNRVFQFLVDNDIDEMDLYLAICSSWMKSTRHLGLQSSTRTNRYFTSRIPYTPNSISTFNVTRLRLATSGDINEGPQ